MRIEMTELPEGIDSYYDKNRDTCVIAAAIALPASLLIQYADAVRTATMEALRSVGG